MAVKEKSLCCVARELEFLFVGPLRMNLFVGNVIRSLVEVEFYKAGNSDDVRGRQRTAGTDRLVFILPDLSVYLSFVVRTPQIYKEPRVATPLTQEHRSDRWICRIIRLIAGETVVASSTSSIQKFAALLATPTSLHLASTVLAEGTEDLLVSGLKRCLPNSGGPISCHLEVAQEIALNNQSLLSIFYA